MSDTLLPCDAWLGTHADGTTCLDWSMGSLKGLGYLACLRIDEKRPILVAMCLDGGERLRWQRVTVMAQNAAVRAGGTVRFEEE